MGSMGQDLHTEDDLTALEAGLMAGTSIVLRRRGTTGLHQVGIGGQAAASSGDGLGAVTQDAVADPESDDSLLMVPVDADGEAGSGAAHAGAGAGALAASASRSLRRPAPQCLATPTHVALALAPRTLGSHGPTLPTHGPADAIAGGDGPAASMGVEVAGTAGLGPRCGSSRRAADSAAGSVGLGDSMPGEPSVGYHASGTCVADGARGPALSSRGAVEADDEALCIALRRILRT